MRFGLLVVLPLAVLATSCASGAPASVRHVPPVTATTTLATAAPLPVATGKPVMVVHTAAGAGSDARLDMNGLTAMSTASIDVYEPFVKKTVHFEGVPLSELLTRAGIATGTVRIHALDDYTFDAKVSDLLATGAFLATSAGGRAIPVAEGGPIRIVYAKDHALAKNTDAWVWSVDSMRQVDQAP